MSSCPNPELKLDWCSHAAAKYAVEHWHYSRRMPMPPLVHVGVWEGGEFAGCVLFAHGANNTIGSEYGLKQTEACELVRVALREHTAPVSRIVAIAVKMLRRSNPGLRLVVSYADSERGHHGGIYQAGNWVYVGRGQGSTEFFHEGRWKHNREVTSGAFGSARKVADYSKLPKRRTLGKHKYLYPLDAAMRAQIAPLAKPYPKRVTRGAGETDSAPQSNAETGGASPTAPLFIATGARVERHDAE